MKELLSEYLNGFIIWGIEVTSFGAVFFLFILSFAVLGMFMMFGETVGEKLRAIQSRRFYQREISKHLDSGRWHWFPKSSLGKNAEWVFDDRGFGYGRFGIDRKWERSYLGELVERRSGEALWDESLGIIWGKWGPGSTATSQTWVI